MTLIATKNQEEDQNLSKISDTRELHRAGAPVYTMPSSDHFVVATCSHSSAILLCQLRLANLSRLTRDDVELQKRNRNTSKFWEDNLFPGRTFSEISSMTRGDRLVSKASLRHVIKAQGHVAAGRVPREQHLLQSSQLSSWTFRPTGLRTT